MPFRAFFLSAVRSRVNTSVSMEHSHQEEDTSQDVCGAFPSESRSSEILQVLKDYGIDEKQSEVDVVQQHLHPPQEVETEAKPMDRAELEETCEVRKLPEVEGSNFRAAPRASP